jgi:hypothetical protein
MVPKSDTSNQMNGLYPIIRRVRRPLLPPDEKTQAVLPVVAKPPAVTPVKAEDASVSAKKEKRLDVKAGN